MSFKPIILSHGNHNNIHLKVKVGGSNKHPLFIFKLVHFFDTEKSYITHSNINVVIKDFLDFSKIEKSIRNGLSIFDYELVILTQQDFLNKGLSTQQILNKL